MKQKLEQTRTKGVKLPTGLFTCQSLQQKKAGFYSRQLILDKTVRLSWIICTCMYVSTHKLFTA